MPRLRSASRCDGWRPLLVLNETMTVPTLAFAARPASLDWSEGPMVAARASADATRHKRTRVTNAAEILLSIDFNFLLQSFSSFRLVPFGVRALEPNQRGEDSRGLLSET